MGVFGVATTRLEPLHWHPETEFPVYYALKTITVPATHIEPFPGKMKKSNQRERDFQA